MIDTLFFALQIVGIGVVIGWAVVHDRLGDGAPVRGPLAFKQADGETRAGRASHRTRPGAGRHRAGTGTEARAPAAGRRIRP